MPRLARIVIARTPHHVVHRGHNRQQVFAEATDYRRYLDELRVLKNAFGVKLHAYCLMTNHVHLLLTPGDDASTLGSMMKSLAARATRYHNRKTGRSGTLWEGRYKSSVVQTDRYFLACCRYIELNPVRAGMVAQPLEYLWSSVRSRMGMAKSDYLDFHQTYLALGSTEQARRANYADLLAAGIDEGERVFIRNAVQRGQLTGEASFAEEIAEVAGRKVETRGRGRPR